MNCTENTARLPAWKPTLCTAFLSKNKIYPSIYLTHKNYKFTPKISNYCMKSIVQHFHEHSWPSDGSREKQLYLPIDTTYKHRTLHCYTAMDLYIPMIAVYCVLVVSMAKKIHNSLSDYRYSNPALHSATPLSAWGRYNYEKLACSSIIVELPNAAEILRTVALQKRQGMEFEIDVIFNVWSLLYLDTTFGMLYITSRSR